MLIDPGPYHGPAGGMRDAGKALVSAQLRQDFRLDGRLHPARDVIDADLVGETHVLAQVQVIHGQIEPGRGIGAQRCGQGAVGIGVGW